MKLHICPELSLPVDVATQTLAILAKRRVGKTYTASVMAEEFVKVHIPFVALDPTGAWWGLRSGKDGKQKGGLPVYVIGGAHGIPLEPTAGKVIAEQVAEHPAFYVIDVSGFESNAAQDRFATDFGERLYRIKDKHRDPLHLFIDEADSFIPQRPMPGQQRMLGAYEAIVRRGGIRGLGVTLITQRTAVLNKNVLEQVECLITLQTTGPNDQDAIDNWVKRNGTPEERETLMASLASLGQGEAWVYSPAWLEVFKKVHIRERETFNSSATPKVGEKKVKHAALIPVDLDKLSKEIKATVEKAHANDPDVLKKRIRELESKATALRPAKIDESVVSRAVQGAVRKSEETMAREMKIVQHLIDHRYKPAMKHAIEALIAAMDLPTMVAHAGPKIGGKPPNWNTTWEKKHKERPPVVPVRNSPQRKDQPTVVDESLSSPEQRILDAIAWMESIGIDTPEQPAVSFLAGYRYGGGAFNNPRGSLRVKGLVEYVGDKIRFTEEGRSRAKFPEGAVSQTELHERVLDRLPAPEKRVLQPLINAYPESLTNEELAEQARYAVNTGGFNNPRGRLRTLGLIEYVAGGGVRAKSLLFPSQE